MKNLGWTCWTKIWIMYRLVAYCIRHVKYPIDEENARFSTSIGIRVLYYYYIGKYFFTTVREQIANYTTTAVENLAFVCKLVIIKHVSLMNTRMTIIPNSEKTWTSNLRKRLQPWDSLDHCSSPSKYCSTFAIF